MEEFDYIIVGSGFGGSVSALRLAEKGYRVAVLERGRRYGAQDFPATNWELKKYLWAPFFKCFGIQCITLFKNVLVLSGSGVGGGSLVYANTLMTPTSAFFRDPAWAALKDWETALAPHYETAKKMLGVVRNQKFSRGDEVLREVGESLGCGETFHSVDVGVYFGEPNQTVKDPFFGGKGPDRTGCNFCGGCMVGCRFNAKNTLDKNYLYLAEQLGVRIFPETEVTKLEPSPGGGYLLNTSEPGAWFSKNKKQWKARKVVLSAGVLGSVKLLLKARDIDGTLPKVSNQLGRTLRTNGESLVGATSLKNDVNYSDGIAISSAIHPDPITKIEIVRYSNGSGFMKMLALPLTGPGSKFVRPFKFLWGLITQFKKVIGLWSVKDWAHNTVILLVMQTVDNQIAMGVRRPWFKFFRKSVGSVPAGQDRIPAYIEVAHKAVEMVAQKIGGVAQNAFSEPLLNTPSTAHILGGAKIGASPEDGVVSQNCEVFGYPGLYVIDGSIIPANLGVNPSLTITALAEHAMSQIKVAKS